MLKQAIRLENELNRSIFKQIKKKWLNTQKQLRNILKSPINKGFQQNSLVFF